MKYKLIKKPEDGYYIEDYGWYRYTSEDWRLGVIAELSPKNQVGNNNERFYVVWTGQCEPFLKKELVENRPDLWEKVDV